MSGTGADPADPAGWHWAPGPAGEGLLGRYRGAGFAHRFPSQAEAEAWLGEAYPELVDLGVDEVSLCQGDRLVYGPMGLSPQ